MNYLVLHVRPYDFKDDDGKRVQGASVTYLDLSSIPLSGTDERGYAPLQLSVDPELGATFTKVPALYDLGFTQRRGRNGRPQLALASAKLQAPVDLQHVGELSV